jgi:hypothetical protein
MGGILMLRFLFVAAAILAMAQSALAEDKSGEIATCLMDNMTETQLDDMREYLIQSLREDEEAFIDAALELNEGYLVLAIEKCGMDRSDEFAPDFLSASSKYSEFLGQLVMLRAINFADTIGQ